MTSADSGTCRLVATDLDIEIRTEIEAAGLALNGAMLSPRTVIGLLGGIGGDNVLLAANDGRIAITGAGLTAMVQILPHDDFPTIVPGDETWSADLPRGIVDATRIRTGALRRGHRCARR